VVLAAPGGGEVDDYRWLASSLDEGYHIVGVREPGHYGTEPRPKATIGLSATCRNALRLAGFDAPVAIVGECSGGLLAHQMACDLAAAGHVVDLVVLLDTPLPGGSGSSAPEDPASFNDVLETVLRRGRNAIALTRMQTQRTWYQLRKQPLPR